LADFWEAVRRVLSVAHGGLRDFNTVRALGVCRHGGEPRLLRHDGEASTTFSMPGVPRHSSLASAGVNSGGGWSQCVVASAASMAAFDFKRAYRN